MTRYSALALVAWCMFSPPNATADDGEEAKAVKALEKLGGLVWPLDPKTSNGIVIFGYKGALSEADLKEAVVHLRKLPNLRVLSLNYTWVTDAGLASLKELPKLEVLHLKVTRVTDAGLTHLNKMRALGN